MTNLNDHKIGQEQIIIKGAREHNLKNFDLDLPINKLIVITGKSGSGKSTLAFDTLYAEGQRRYVESLSAYARQFLGLMDKPEVDSIKGLSPAISIEQKTVSKNPRSTVGTITEIYDYLRLLFARVGIPHCPKCGKEIKNQSAESIVDIILKEKANKELAVYAPVARGQKGTFEKLFDQLHKEGFGRVVVDNELFDLEDRHKINLNKNFKHNIEVIVDRFVTKKIESVDEMSVEENEYVSRVTEAVEAALDLTNGLVLIDVEGKRDLYSQDLVCLDCGISFEPMQPRSFSFNSPFGACPDCHGLGTARKFDPDLVIPDKSLTILEGAIAPWKTIGEGWRVQLIESLAKHYKINPYVPISKLDKDFVDKILYGTDEKIRFEIASRDHGTEHSFFNKFEGVIPNMDRLYMQTDSPKRREDMEKFMRITECPVCKGKRLKPEILAVKILNNNIDDITQMSVEQALKFFKSLKYKKGEREIADPILKEVKNRLQFLIDVGLDYLTLSRSAGTLSGGEGQRIRLATQIGSELRGVLYILDEPSIGLHQRDNKKLIATLKKLRDLGNTVIVVEHDEETMRSADYLVDLGPGAGIHGGEVVAKGTPKEVAQNPNSLTGQYLSGEKEIEIPSYRRLPKSFIEIEGAREHNLKNIDVKIPLGLFACVTGVSGSGKSTLINEILYKGLAKIINHSQEKPGKHSLIKGFGFLNNVHIIDQSPIGRTPRSNPATYIGVFTPIRDLFSMTREARARGYKPGRFSFNVKGGRCEHCEGDGYKKIEMHFLPDVFVLCEKCKGKRYNRETLEVRYKGKNIAQVLDMSVEEALDFFENIPTIANKLRTLYDVGLGYIKLGQSATTLSGGEAQRVKLTSELAKRGRGNTLYILDEPTTGLHVDDVKKLLEVLNSLVNKGNSVLVIEHNMDVIKSSDYVIDLGPEGGDKGGKIIATGTPEEIIRSKKSYTAQYLKKVLS